MTESEFSLSDHHRDLEQHFQRLMTRCHGGDPVELRCEWALFERELGEHMALEEKEILPRFGRAHPAEAAQIRLEHREIRAALAELGVALDLHMLRAEAVAEFIKRLRAHASREDDLFYPWLAQHAPTDERWLPLGRQLASLSRSIGAAFGARSDA